MTAATEASSPAVAQLERRVVLAHALALARVAVEALLVGAGVGMVVLGVAALEERTPSSPSSAAILAGACAALGWWLERRPERGATVRRIDRRCELDGGLVTLSEWRSAPTQRFTDLLARRLETRLRGSALVRAVTPAHPAMMALPCLAAAFYLWARSTPAAVEPRTAPGATSSASSALDQLEARARVAARGRDGSADVNAQVAAFASEWRRLASVASTDSTSVLQRASDAERPALLERGRALERDPRLDPQLRRALSDALRAATFETRAAPSSTGERTAASNGSNLRTATDASGAASTPSVAAGADVGVGRESSEPSLATGNPSATSGLATTAPPTSASEPAPAVSSAGTWWSPRYDAVVERWVEARRSPR